MSSVIKPTFTTHDITMIAVFFALMQVVEIIWIPGPIIGHLAYGILFGIVLITAAIVIGKKYTILTLGILNTILNLFFAHMYGGTLAAFSYLTAAIALEGILQISKPYAGNQKINIIGATLYGFVSRVTFVIILVFVYGWVLPSWIIIGTIVSFTIEFGIGGYLGHRFGNKIKNVVESL